MKSVRSMLCAVLLLPACGTSSSPSSSPYDASMPSDGGVDDTSTPADADPDQRNDSASSDAPEDATLDSQPTDAEVDAAPDAPSDASSDTWVSLGDGVWVTPPHPAQGQSVRLRYEGVLSNASTLVAHYGFDGWNAIPGATGTEQDDGTGNVDVYWEKAMEPGDGGAGFETEIPIPASARALHVVFRGTTGGVETWDSQAGRDYNVGIRFPYLGPFLTWRDAQDPSTSMTVHFHSGYLCNGKVEYGVGGAFTQSAAGSSSKLMHHVVLTGLSPDTAYDYRVRCEGGDASEPHAFRTAPAAASDVSFVVLADAQDNGEDGRWGDVAEAASSGYPSASFVLFAGDMPWNDKPGLWWMFFDRGRALFADKPLLAMPGNHDTPTADSSADRSSFRFLFGLDETPPGNTWQALRWGPAGLVVFDSEVPSDFVLGSGAQSTWAQQALTSWGGAAPAWVFAALHIPPYNAGARHFGQQGEFRDLTSLFDGRVDWVFSGHEHLFQRMKPLRYNGILAPSGLYGRGPADGVGYLVLPPAGAWPETALIDWNDPKAYYRDRLATPVPPAQQNDVPSEDGFTVVDVQGNALRIRAFGLGDHDTPTPVHGVDDVQYAR